MKEKKKNFFDLGYKRSNKNPLLFWKPIGKVRLFIDFRDPLWKRFYFFPLSKLTPEEKEEYQPKIIEEYNLARKNYVWDYLDFYDLSGCMQCGKDFIFGDYEFRDIQVCSKGCLIMLRKEFAKDDKKAVIKWKKSKCFICKEIPELEDKKFPIFYVDERHRHHTDYRKGKERTIPVCGSCHTKITFHLDKYPELKHFKPLGSRKKMLESKKKKRNCVDCGEELKGRARKYCPECKSKKYTLLSSKKKKVWIPKKKEPSPMLRAWLKKD